MTDKIRRRDFLRGIAGAGAAALVAGCAGKGTDGPRAGAPGAAAPRLPEHALGADPVVAVASGGSIEGRVEGAIEALGGMERFVKSGQVVVIKPNAAWQRSPQQAATTNPQVVAELIRLCRQQQAARVIVAEHMIDSPPRLVWDITGLGEAVAQAGGRAVAVQEARGYVKMNVPEGKVLSSDDVMREVLEADVVINVPIAKNHGSTVITAALKNWMGVIWNRQHWHATDLHQCIADLSTAMRADLVVLDATRVLLTNGPKGPGQTRDVGEVVAGLDPVAVDAYAATLLDLKPHQVPHIELAHQAGVGEMNLDHIQFQHVKA